MDRRQFLKTSAASGGAVLLLQTETSSATENSALAPIVPGSPVQPLASRLPNLEPARWIWYPSGRTLPNTFILFRREISLPARPRKVTGWVAADSRYRLEVNGRRLQWGPPPSDPRWPEADPVDLTESLQAGLNVIGATVLFYGQGDGTSPLGKPGFLFWLVIEHADGANETIVTDAGWRALLCRAWRPGHYKRWYLRALQEEFDARLYPQGWSQSDFVPGDGWLPAMPLNGSPNKPAISTTYYEYMSDVGSGPANAQLRARSIPLMRETLVPVAKLTESLRLEWIRPPQDYFEFRILGAYKAERQSCATETSPGVWQVELDGTRGAALTFEFTEQLVGWPCFTIEAPEGTVVELLVHEAHSPGGPALLNTHFDSWTRFICREGINHFETFEFESLRWLQLHVHDAKGKIILRDIAVRRRIYPWLKEPRVRVGEPALQRLMDASLNTLNNCAQETLVDGMARERQQYSGDGGHQLHGVHLAFGESRLPARFLTTWSQGLTKDGFFLDCWPAYDRLARLAQRQLDLSNWGPILDHGVGFNFDCWHHYQYTGDLDALREPFPRLLRFADYLRGLVGPDGLLPVDNLGIPSVWMDHIAYQNQRQKQCAFNLYAAAAMQHALAPICRAFKDKQAADAADALGASLLRGAQRAFWSREHGLFVNNLPWLAKEKQPRLCDRSLATAVLFDQCPEGQNAPAVRALAEAPANMGLSYPANACWRYWALAKAGRTDVIVNDFRGRWARMDSVRLNNTLQEDWTALADSGQQWSHCPVVPLYLAFHGLAGIRPLAPGFQRVEIRPEPADLADLELTAHTARGPIQFQTHGRRGNRELSVELPDGCTGELLLRNEEKPGLDPAPGATPPGYSRYALPKGKTQIGLKFT